MEWYDFQLGWTRCSVRLWRQHDIFASTEIDSKCVAVEREFEFLKYFFFRGSFPSFYNSRPWRRFSPSRSTTFYMISYPPQAWFFFIVIYFAYQKNISSYRSIVNKHKMLVRLGANSKTQILYRVRKVYTLWVIQLSFGIRIYMLCGRGACVGCCARSWWSKFSFCCCYSRSCGCKSLWRIRILSSYLSLNWFKKSHQFSNFQVIELWR